jgi:hypothetical protein
MPEYDYVISRGVIEHIPRGLELIFKTRWRNRLIFNVPYDEKARNPHHTLLGITEKDLGQFPHAELFYEDLHGVTYDAGAKPAAPNMITCACRASFLPRVGEMSFGFPLPAWVETVVSD